MRELRRRGGRGAVALLVFLSAASISALAVAQSAETAPPPTPVPRPGGQVSPSPFLSVLRTPPPSTEPPEIRAAASLLADVGTGQVLLEVEAETRRPIASLTKIMTGLLVINATDPRDVVTVSTEAAAPLPVPGVSNLGLQPGEQVSVRDLLYALLLQSANDAAEALAEHVAGSVEAFVSEMNAEARRLGLEDSYFASPNGLDDSGYSTARDLITLTRTALKHPLFARIVRTQFREIPSQSGVPRIVQNRNVLLWLYPGAIGVKTGFTSAAGFCVVAVAERDGVALVAVVLGEPSEAFSDAATLLEYGFTAFEQRELVGQGEPLGTVPIAGRAVRVAAGRPMVALVPAGAEPRRRIAAMQGVAFPPAIGEKVGVLSVWTDGKRLGRVPLVVKSVPGPPAPEAGPWWRRTGSAVVHAVESVLGALFG
ncbi:MAG: D-alanyl-D-alanine carboxypeptidase family protein [Actinomycetota bacterium]